MVCPVCREPLTYDLDQLLSAPEPQLPQVENLETLLRFCSDQRGTRLVLSGGPGSHQLQLQAEVGGAAEAAGEAAIQGWSHRPGGGVQPLPHPHQRGESSSQLPAARS